eukprot:12301776-Alexandrium_andersonii.AAC.1
MGWLRNWWARTSFTRVLRMHKTSAETPHGPAAELARSHLINPIAMPPQKVRSRDRCAEVQSGPPRANTNPAHSEASVLA